MKQHFFGRQARSGVAKLRLSPQRLQTLVLAIFGILGLWGILHHAMWRDEMNVWLIVRDSVSWLDFWQNVRYEGHPLLWYLTLAFWNFWTDNPLMMQLWHWALGMGVVMLFWRFAPFQWLHKLLFTFGYFPFYEYLLISRNYAIAILCLFGFCAAFPTRRRRYFGLSFLLALLVNTNAYALLIGFALGVMLVVEYGCDRDLRQAHTLVDIIVSLLIALAGMTIALYVIFPPSDSYLQGGTQGWFSTFDGFQLARSLSRLWSAYVVILIPADSRNFDGVLFGAIALLILAAVSLSLWRKPFPLLFYWLASGEILCFTYVKFLGSLRHYGHLYFILMATLWLAADYTAQNRSFPWPILARGEQWLKRWQTHCLTLLLSLQLIGGVIAYSRDYFYPFSASKATAEYLASSGRDRAFLIGSEDHVMAPLCGYLNRKIYYPERQQMGSFTLFNRERQVVDHNTVLAQTQQILETQEEEVVLILNRPLESNNAQLKVDAIASFEDGLIYNEKYHLYTVQLNQNSN